MVKLARRDPSEIVDDGFTRMVIGCAITVHKATGTGLLENAYETFLAHELQKNGFSVVRHPTLPAMYDGVSVNLGYVPDLIVDGRLIIEVKAVFQLLPIHEAQLLTYLRLSGIRVGLLMNFHANPLAKGIRRLVV
jgi:GxxExxY protein